MAEPRPTPDSRQPATSAPVTAGGVAERVAGRLHGDARVVLSGATHDSGAAEPGWLFCCVVGAHHDGHDHAAAAVQAGASALLVERDPNGPHGLSPSVVGDVPQIVVEDTRAAMAGAAAEIHGDPSSDLVVVGVTGTNGKTTVVSLLGWILESCGRRVEVIGTLTGARTTPESTDLQARLAELRAEGVTHVAMEVSSHALALHRVDSVQFDVAVFTNLGTDHLDFHGTPQAYFAAKATLFEPDHSSRAVINVDDVRGRLLRDASRIPVREYSVDALADLSLHAKGSSFTWDGVHVDLSVPGRHNVANALAAADAALAVGEDRPAIAEALGRTPSVPGRFEVVDRGQPFSVVVDYAHTPDALASVIDAARGIAQPGGRLLVVFGCGGDRDAGKRPEMGRAVCEGADETIITTDNPRSEDPLRIIEQIRTGCSGEPLIEPDRRAAIHLAISRARPGDVVVIAGKGHEQGQQFADHTDPFDDRAVAAEELDALDAGGEGSSEGERSSGDGRAPGDER